MANRCGQTETTAQRSYFFFPSYSCLIILKLFLDLPTHCMSWGFWPPSCTWHNSCLLLSLALFPHILVWDEQAGHPFPRTLSVPLPSAQNGDFLSSPYRSPFVIKSFLWAHLPAVNQYANAIQERTQGLASRAELCTSRAQKLFISNKPKKKKKEKKIPQGAVIWSAQLALPGFLISTSQHSGTCLVRFAGLLRERRSSQEQGPISIKLDHSPSEKTCQINATGHSIQDCRFESGKKMHLGKLDR